MTPGSGLWIFGYGSLVWRPEFPHVRACRAWIEGHARRFWQGSIDHRGLPGRPGRVVTLLPADHPDVVAEAARADARPFDPRCWGTAYQVAPADVGAVLAALDHRERGGYERLVLALHLEDEAAPARRVEGLVYVAGPDNAHYLGPAPIDAIARQIAGARGPSGDNDAYLEALAQALRRMGVVDDHVFALEAALEALRAGRAARGD